MQPDIYSLLNSRVPDHNVHGREVGCHIHSLTQNSDGTVTITSEYKDPDKISSRSTTTFTWPEVKRADPPQYIWDTMYRIYIVFRKLTTTKSWLSDSGEVIEQKVEAIIVWASSASDAAAITKAINKLAKN